MHIVYVYFVYVQWRINVVLRCHLEIYYINFASTCSRIRCAVLLIAFLPDGSLIFGKFPGSNWWFWLGYLYIVRLRLNLFGKNHTTQSNRFPQKMLIALFLLWLTDAPQFPFSISFRLSFSGLTPSRMVSSFSLLTNEFPILSRANQFDMLRLVLYHIDVAVPGFHVC